MQNSLTKKSLFTKRIVPVLLTFVLMLSMLVTAFSVIGANAAGGTTAANEKIYFNLSNNTSWYSSGMLYARFYSGSTLLKNAACTSMGGGVYEASAPAGADSVDLAVLPSANQTMLNNWKSGRVFFDNSAKNWATPYAYNWQDDSTNTGAWPGKPMTLLSGKIYYYDTSYENIIFNKGGDNAGDDQTADLKVPVDARYFNGTSWNSIFTKTSSKLNFSNRASGANEIYLSGSNLQISKYAYPAHSFSNGKTVYVYNPNWTSAYVTYDLSDPYRTTVQMTAVEGKPTGFYQATVPADSEFSFAASAAGYGSSQQTKFPDDASLNCYKITTSSEVWVNVDDAQRITTDYYAEKGTTGANNSGAFWVEATYFDYLSDTERSGSWLNPSAVGTRFGDSPASKADNWYPFYDFNNYISSITSDWSTPLYFGNFCNTSGSYPYDRTRNGGYGKAIENLHDFNYIANNSNGLPSYNYAVSGLAYNKLNADGDIQYANGKVMPYFDTAALSGSSYAKTVQSYFPFRSVTDQATKVTTYSFNSKNAQDNVFFKWTNGQPSVVNYGQGTGYGIGDGNADFTYGATQGKGIFPFNGGTNNPGNGNLNFGFGVKLDMDFRVPANGTLDGTAGGEAVKFDFTGDDDLWVYLSEVDDDGNVDYSTSVLALDLGGAHKETHGTINFKTMQSTVDKIAAIKDSKYKSDMIVITDSYSWGKSNLRLWAWSDTYGGEWFYASNAADLGGGEYGFSASMTGSAGHQLGEMKYFQAVKGNWEEQVKNEKGWDGMYEEYAGSKDGNDIDGFLVQTHFGKKTYTDHLAYTADLSDNWRTTSTNKSANINLLAGNAKLDPSKMYHMTVFYMERGLIESNCKIEFTMTPAQNDYKVEKKVNTVNVNTGLAADTAAKDEFNFTTTGKYANANVTRTAKLENNGIEDYDNKFDTGCTLKTSETGVVVKGTDTASNLTYDTSWVVVDTDAGDLVENGSGTGRATNNFTLARKDGTNDTIHLKSTFTNTPQVAPVTVNKTILEEDGATVANKIDTFSYTIKVDLAGGTNYKAYPLDYEVNGHAATMSEDGAFSFSSDETVVIPNLPVGATYQITESNSAGYTAVSKTLSGTVGTDDSVTFQNQITPSDTKIKATKTLDGKAYTGEMFDFVLEGLPEMGIPTVNLGKTTVSKTVDTSEDSGTDDATKLTQSKLTNGNIEFTVDYTHAGVYRYKLYEVTKKLSDYDTEKGTTYADDIQTPKTYYLVSVTVKDQDDTLAVSAPEYYKYTPEEGAAADPVFTSAHFASSAKVSGTPTFANTIQKASVTVIKTDQANQAVSGVTFALYRVSGKGADIQDKEHPYKTALTEEKRVEGVNKGAAEFTDIDIYKEDFDKKTLVEDPYQWYCLVEVDPSSGYNLNSKPYYFQFPTNGEYSYTAEYVNGKIVNPNASGEGMQIFKTVGIGVSGLALISLFGYIVYYKKRTSGKTRRAQR